MRAIVQRVETASVTVDGDAVGEIGPGILLLVGVTHDDSAQDAQMLADKAATLRIFGDESGKMNRSVLDIGGSVLVVSQFTVYGDARKGRRPSFTAAAAPERAEDLIGVMCERLRTTGLPVATGRFQAAMKVALVNDGPVTMVIETREGRFL